MQLILIKREPRKSAKQKKLCLIDNESGIKKIQFCLVKKEEDEIVYTPFNKLVQMIISFRQIGTEKLELSGNKISPCEYADPSSRRGLINIVQISKGLNYKVKVVCQNKECEHFLKNSCAKEY